MNATTGETLHEVSSPSILAATESRPFWLRVEGGVFELGQGHDVGANTFFTWTDVTPTAIHGLGIATPWTPEGFWQFNSYVGTLEHVCILLLIYYKRHL